jgi:hypothetical protein
MKISKINPAINKTYRAMTFAIVIALISQFVNAQSAIASNEITTEVPSGLNTETILFQEWYAGIEVGGTGINVFVPIVNQNSDIVIDSVYFRNLKGKLIQKDGKYFASLENTSKLYTFKKSKKPADYPFNLKDNECVITYTENGKSKYFKVTQLNEVAGTYYENGPKSIYTGDSDSRIAANK